jgi:SET domain-containing protein
VDLAQPGDSRKEGDSSYLVARRDIAASEEITCEYKINSANGTAWPCRCAT